MNRNDLLKLRGKELSDILRDGYPIDRDALDNVGYRGISLGLPAFFEKLTWKTFQKTFFRDPTTGLLRGWNVRVEQRGLDAPTQPKLKGGRPWTFGHYRVVDSTGSMPRIGKSRGLLIHYGMGGNAAFDPTSRLRDPIVALEPGRVDRLLGWSYVDLGLFSMGTPSFFLLEREGPLTHIAHPPRRG